jgi:hypothetical protein
MPSINETTSKAGIEEDTKLKIAAWAIVAMIIYLIIAQ